MPDKDLRTLSNLITSITVMLQFDCQAARSFANIGRSAVVTWCPTFRCYFLLGRPLYWSLAIKMATISLFLSGLYPHNIVRDAKCLRMIGKKAIYDELHL